jgi:hypothetical protein
MNNKMTEPYIKDGPMELNLLGKDNIPLADQEVTRYYLKPKLYCLIHE